MNTNHYPDLERCKKLTEIGFPHEECIGFYRYPSVMELLDVIPWAIEKDDGPRFFTLDKHSPIDNEEDHYDVGYMDETDTLLYSHTNTLPNALCDLIFWLHENNYIKF